MCFVFRTVAESIERRAEKGERRAERAESGGR